MSKLVIFGNGAISKTFQAINDFNMEIVTVDIDEKTKPNIVGSIYDEKLKKSLLKQDDILVDLTENIRMLETPDWCWKNNIRMVSCDMGYPIDSAEITREEMYNQYLKVAETRKNGPTMVFSMGMNPGMVSIYFNELIKKFKIKIEEIEEVHVSEMDTQISDLMPEENQVISTWSVFGCLEDMHQESVLSEKQYWKTKLKKINKKAINNAYWSKNPWYGKFKTFLSGNHEEIYEIGNTHKIPVCFSYKPPVQFLEATKKIKNIDNIKKHIMTPEDTLSGENIVGIYLLLKNGKEFWCGSKMTIEQAKKIIKKEIPNVILNGTTTLTAAGVIAGVYEAIENKNSGYRMPLEFDSSKILNYALPYIGKFVNQKIS